MTVTEAPVAGPGRRGLAGWLDRYREGLSGARSTLFWACLARQRPTLKWLMFILVIASVALFQIANLTRGMVDNAIVAQTAPLWPYVTHIVFWAVWALVFGFVQMQLGDRLSYGMEFDLRVWMYTHVQSAELQSLDRVATGQLVTRSITDLQLVEQLLRVFPTLVGFAPLLIALAVVVTILSPWMGVLVVLALPVNLVLLARFNKPLRALSWTELNERAEVTRAIDEPVRGIRVVKAFGREDDESRKVATATSRAFHYSMARVRLLARYEGVMKAIPILTQAALLGVGAWRVTAGALSLGTFLLAFQLGAGLSAFAGVFNELASAWQYLRSAQDRLAEMLGLSARPVTDGRLPAAPSVGLEIDDVTVTYGDRQLLHGLSLTVSRGELTVVHGPPGAGKSTLAGVASGLVEASCGEARLDGIPLADLNPTALRRAVRVVSEEPLLLAGTLRDNLLLGAWGTIADDELVAALATAGAEDVVRDIEGGLDGTIGDRGLTVSGGQRQRISLGRALVARPGVLILDDALSAVNPSLEIEIMRRVRAALPATAILYITRRAGLVDIADHAVELAPASAIVGTSQSSAVALSHLLDEDESITPAQWSAGLDPVAALVDIDEVGLAGDGAVAILADDASGVLAPSDISALARVDPTLAEIVGSLEVRKERIAATDEMTYRDELKGFFSIARFFRTTLLLTLLLLGGAALCSITPDLVFGQITNVVRGRGDDVSPALSIAGLLVIVGALYGISSWRGRIEAQRFVQNVVLLLRRRVFRRITNLGVNYYDRELPGDVATRVVADLDAVLRFAGGVGFVLVSSIAISVIGTAAMLILAPGVWWVVLLMYVLILAVTAAQLPVATRAFGWAREELQVLTRRFQEDFSSRHEIRHLGAHAIQTQKYVEACWDRRRARWWATTVQNFQAALVNFFATVMGALLLWRTGTGVLGQEFSIGTALAVQVLASTATLPLRSLGAIYNQLIDTGVSWRRLQQPFAEPILPVDATDAELSPPLGGTIRFESVVFAYPSTDRSVLRGASFSLEPGKVTALVGYTGAGKSSIAKLLMRMYDPDAGSITHDGSDIRRFTLASYRKQIGVVPQDPFLFKGTVASNIRYGKPDATDAEVDAAITAVGSHPLLSVLPNGLEHVVEEEGHNLTSAQRQLVSLARAWLARPSLLVLDEATSLLDSEVEDQVIAAVRDLGCTTLIITHRENVARLADKIVVLEDGTVVDEGPEATVARHGGPYDRLWRV